jgi:gas vesicle protein
MAGAKSFAGGSSIGDSLMTGIGTALGGPVGGAIGGMVGSVFGFSDKDGVEDKNKVQKVNEDLEDTNKTLKEFGINYEYIKGSTEDNADWLSGLFGGEDWETENLEEAKLDLEEMKEIADEAKGVFSGLGSSLSNSLKNAMSYTELKAQFKQSVGRALQDALVNALVTTGIIGDKLKDLSGEIAYAVKDGVLTDKELKSIENSYEGITDHLSSSYEVIEELRDSTDLIDPSMDASVDNSYSAGSTSNITYHQQFVVEAGAMMGDRQDAEEFAEFISEYIQEVMDRNAGK